MGERTRVQGNDSDRLWHGMAVYIPNRTWKNGRYTIMCWYWFVLCSSCSWTQKITNNIGSTIDPRQSFIAWRKCEKVSICCLLCFFLFNKKLMFVLWCCWKPAIAVSWNAIFPKSGHKKWLINALTWACIAMQLWIPVADGAWNGLCGIL